MNPEDWQLHNYSDGDAELVHTVCRDSYEVGFCTLADLLHIASEHGCTGPPPKPPVARCEHGAPVQFCRQHGPVNIPIIR